MEILVKGGMGWDGNGNRGFNPFGSVRLQKEVGLIKLKTKRLGERDVNYYEVAPYSTYKPPLLIASI